MKRGCILQLKDSFIRKITVLLVIKLFWLIKEVISNPLPSIGNQAIPILIVGTVIHLGVWKTSMYLGRAFHGLFLRDLTGLDKNFLQEALGDWVTGILTFAQDHYFFSLSSVLRCYSKKDFIQYNSLLNLFFMYLKHLLLYLLHL